MIYAHTPSLLSAPPLVLFHDDFSSGGLAHTQNGGAWLPNQPSLVQVNTVNPMPGRQYSVQFSLGSFSNDVELRLGTLLTSLDEIYLQWYVYFPNGNETPSVGPRVVTTGGVQNDKFFRGWGDTNLALGQRPAANTIGASMWVNGTGGYTMEMDCNQPATTVTNYTNIAIDAVDATKVTSTPSLSQYTNLVIPAVGGFSGGTYQVLSVAAGVATLSASAGALSSTGGTGTGYFPSISVGSLTPGYANFVPNVLGRWTQVRVRAKMATIANNDGIEQMWLDGVLVANWTTLANYSGIFGPTRFSNFYFFGAQNSPVQTGRMLYFADFTASLGGFVQ